MTAGMVHVTAGMVHAMAGMVPMTAGMVHMTNLTPPGSGNPSRAYGRRHQLMTAGMVHVTNLTPTTAPCHEMVEKEMHNIQATLQPGGEAVQVKNEL
jgi:hypothetical protein